MREKKNINLQIKSINLHFKKLAIASFLGVEELIVLAFITSCNLRHIVKLPHHGSGKSNLKRFIREYDVNYYLVSTDGNQGHPSKMIMGNILCRAKEHPMIVTNYHLPMLEGLSIMGEDVIIDG